MLADILAWNHEEDDHMVTYLKIYYIFLSWFIFSI